MHLRDSAKCRSTSVAWVRAMFHISVSVMLQVVSTCKLQRLLVCAKDQGAWHGRWQGLQNTCVLLTAAEIPQPVADSEQGIVDVLAPVQAGQAWFGCWLALRFRFCLSLWKLRWSGLCSNTLCPHASKRVGVDPVDAALNLHQ